MLSVIIFINRKPDPKYLSFNTKMDFLRNLGVEKQYKMYIGGHIGFHCNGHDLHTKCISAAILDFTAMDMFHQ